MQDEEKDLLHFPFTSYIILDSQKSKRFNAEEINSVKKYAPESHLKAKADSLVCCSPLSYLLNIIL